jgi:hypothetical protein
MSESTASLPYGPNTAAVRRFLQRLAGKPVGDCVAAARAYLSLQATPDFLAADRALGKAIDRGERTEARDAIVGPIVQLMGSHTERIARDPGLGVGPDDLAESALAATLGLVARDLLPGAAFDVLYRPFADLIPVEELEPRSGD